MRRRVRPVPPEFSPAIRRARRATGLTQEALGRRLGLGARSIGRWEMGTSIPPARMRKLLVAAVQATHPNAAAALAAVFASHGKDPLPPAPPAPPPVDHQKVLRELLFHAADSLDVTPRRTREAVARLFDGLAAAGITLEQAAKELGAWRAREVAPPRME